VEQKNKNKAPNWRVGCLKHFTRVHREGKPTH
jgi:hypothetical protein